MSESLHRVRDEPAQEFGVVHQLPGNLIDRPSLVGTEFDESLARLIFEVVDEVESLVLEGHTTGGTEPGFGLGKPRLTLRTVAELRGVDFLVVDKTHIDEDAVTRFLSVDVVVLLDHVRTLLPSGASFYLGLCLTLTSPVRDSPVPEVVGLHSGRRYICASGYPPEQVPDVVVRKRPALNVFPFDEDVPEGRFVVVGVGMGVQPRNEVAPRPGDRERSLGSLRPGGFLVRIDLTALADELDVFDPEGSEGTDTETRVGEHSEEGAVTRVVTGVEQFLYLVGIEEFVGVDLAVDGRPDFDLVVPVAFEVFVEPLERLLVVTDGSIGEGVVLVGTGSFSEIEEENVDICLVKVDECEVSVLDALDETREVVDDGGLLNGVHPPGDERFDGFVVSLVDVDLVELLALPLERAVEVVDVVDVCHERDTTLCVRIKGHFDANPRGTNK